MLDTNGIQLTESITRLGALPGHYRRDRSQRPYMKEVVPAWGFLLSDAYISLSGHRPSLTALQIIREGSTVLGYLGADFDLRNLPVTAELYREPDTWRQVKGDPHRKPDGSQSGTDVFDHGGVADATRRVSVPDPVRQ